MNLHVSICRHPCRHGRDDGVRRPVENGCRALFPLRHDVDHAARTLRLMAILTDGR
jgi:hypothetical protein